MSLFSDQRWSEAFAHLPDYLGNHLRVSLAALALGLVHAAIAQPDGIGEALAIAALRGAVTAAAFFGLWALYRRLRGREGIGLGDVKLAGVAGAWLDWPSIPIAVEIAAGYRLLGEQLGRELQRVLGDPRTVEQFLAARRQRFSTASPAGTTVAVADTRGSAVLLYAVDGKPRLLATLSLPGGPYGLAADIKRHRLWVALSGRNQLVLLDLGAKKLTEQGPRYATVQQPNSVAVSETTGEVVIAGATPEGTLQLLGNR